MCRKQRATHPCSTTYTISNTHSLLILSNTYLHLLAVLAVIITPHSLTLHTHMHASSSEPTVTRSALQTHIITQGHNNSSSEEAG